MTNVFALTQRAYRWYNDDGSESAGTAAAAENTALTVKPNGTKQYILRVGLAETGAGSIAGATTDDYQLQRSYDGGAYANVTTSSTVVKGFNSTNLTDAGTTTNRASDALSDGGGSFVAGEIAENGLITDRQITANNFTEFIYTVEVVPADVADGKNIDFRILLNGATTNMTYTVTPRITISTVDACLANDVASASSVTSPAVGQVHALLANDVSSASSVTSPAIGQVHVLTADDVSSASSVSVPELEENADTVDDLLAEDVTSASSVSTPAIGQVHALAADDVASASSVTAPAIGQVHVLNASDVSSASSVSAPALGQVHGLLANDVASASSVGSPALGQVHALLANDVSAASSVSEPNLSEGSDTVDNLLAEDIASASSVGTPTLGQVHVLLAVSVSSASGVSTPAISLFIPIDAERIGEVANENRSASAPTENRVASAPAQASTTAAVPIERRSNRVASETRIKSAA